MQPTKDAAVDGLKRKVMIASVAAGIFGAIAASVQYYVSITFVNGILDALQDSLPLDAFADVPDYNVSGNHAQLAGSILAAFLLPGLGYLAVKREDKNLVLGFTCCSCWNCCFGCLTTVIMLLILVIMSFTTNLLDACDPTVHCPLRQNNTRVVGLVFDRKAVDCLLKSQWQANYTREYPDWGEPMAASCPNALFLNCTYDQPTMGLVEVQAHHQANTAAWVSLIADLQNPHTRAFGRVASSFGDGLASLGTRLDAQNGQPLYPGSDPSPSSGGSLLAQTMPDDPLATCAANDFMYVGWLAANRSVSGVWNTLSIFVYLNFFIGLGSMVLACLGVYWGCKLRSSISERAFAQTAPVQQYAVLAS